MKNEAAQSGNVPAEADHERFVMTIPAAGRKFFGVGRSASYEAARRGEIPTVRIGRKLLVPIAAIERMLAEAGARGAPLLAPIILILIVMRWAA